MNKHAIVLDIDPQQEVFTHKDSVGKLRSFPIGTMKTFLADFLKHTDLVKLVNVPITKRTADYMRSNHGIEQERVDRLAGAYLEEPGISIDWGDGEVTIIDGAHRIVKRQERGDTEMPSYVFHRLLWEQFLLPEDFSERVVAAGCLTRNSRVLEYEQRQKPGSPFMMARSGANHT